MNRVGRPNAHALLIQVNRGIIFEDNAELLYKLIKGNGLRGYIAPSGIRCRNALVDCQPSRPFVNQLQINSAFKIALEALVVAPWRLHSQLDLHFVLVRVFVDQRWSHAYLSAVVAERVVQQRRVYAAVVCLHLAARRAAV